MASQELKNYIRERLTEGYSEQALREVIGEAGWGDEDIESAFSDRDILPLLSSEEGSGAEDDEVRMYPEAAHSSSQEDKVRPSSEATVPPREFTPEEVEALARDSEESPGSVSAPNDPSPKVSKGDDGSGRVHNLSAALNEPVKPAAAPGRPGAQTTTPASGSEEAQPKKQTSRRRSVVAVGIIFGVIFIVLSVIAIAVVVLLLGDNGSGQQPDDPAPFGGEFDEGVADHEDVFEEPVSVEVRAREAMEELSMFAVLYEEQSGSFSDVCATEPVVRHLTTLEEMSDEAALCNDSDEGFVAEVSLDSGRYCVDSVGFSGFRDEEEFPLGEGEVVCEPGDL